MRKIGSYLVILLFLTAYGRCVADQFGMLHASNASCCVTVCDDTSENVRDTCGQCPDTGNDHPAGTNQPGHEGDHGKQNNQQGDHDAPPPCQLCFILDSDSMLLEDAVKIPSPVLHDLPDFLPTAISPDGISNAHALSFLPDANRSDHADPQTDQRSRLLRTHAKTTPVRGPSIA